MTGISTTALQMALQHLAEAGKTASTLVKPNLSAEVQAVVLSINREIMLAQSSGIAAQQEHAAMLDRVRELERKIREMEDRSSDCSRYVPKKMDTGVRVFVLKEEEQSGETTHEACPHCHSQGKVSILKPTGGRKHWTDLSAWFRENDCPDCKNTFSYGYMKPDSSGSRQQSRPDYF